MKSQEENNGDKKASAVHVALGIGIDIPKI
jgi:hypothetical protein